MLESVAALVSHTPAIGLTPSLNAARPGFGVRAHAYCFACTLAQTFCPTNYSRHTDFLLSGIKSEKAALHLTHSLVRRASRDRRRLMPLKTYISLYLASNLGQAERRCVKVRAPILSFGPLRDACRPHHNRILQIGIARLKVIRTLQTCPNDHAVHGSTRILNRALSPRDRSRTRYIISVLGTGDKTNNEIIGSGIRRGHG
jgi:hypothetical protein